MAIRLDAARRAVLGAVLRLDAGRALFLRRRRKGDIPRAVVSLIAGISLLDALLVAGAGAPGLALAALAGFGLTLFLQRHIAGT